MFFWVLEFFSPISTDSAKKKKKDIKKEKQRIFHVTEI